MIGSCSCLIVCRRNYDGKREPASAFSLAQGAGRRLSDYETAKRRHPPFELVALLCLQTRLSSKGNPRPKENGDKEDRKSGVQIAARNRSLASPAMLVNSGLRPADKFR
jgi:hypothetical protein